jgi:hypothetical protein
MTVQTMAVRRRQRPSGTGRNRPFTNLKPATQSFQPARLCPKSVHSTTAGKFKLEVLTHDFEKGTGHRQAESPGLPPKFPGLSPWSLSLPLFLGALPPESGLTDHSGYVPK